MDYEIVDEQQQHVISEPVIVEAVAPLSEIARPYIARALILFAVLSLLVVLRRLYRRYHEEFSVAPQDIRIDRRSLRRQQQ